MKNSGKGMLKSQLGRGVQNLLWRKLFCRFRIGVSALQTSNCRRSNKGKGCSIGLSLCSVQLRRNILASLDQYTYGRSEASLSYYIFVSANQ